VIREIDIWRVAVLMVKRYADDAEANADRRADELETQGDRAGAAIWRRVTVAIEQLMNTVPTGPLHLSDRPRQFYYECLSLITGDLRPVTDRRNTR
jgi:hypothetical protein